MTLYNSGGDIEYVKVTSTDDDEFTVVRGQDGTTARAWLADDMAACRPIAAALEEVVSLPDNLAHSGINLDITELRGLTTPLSAEQGGTGEQSLSDSAQALLNTISATQGSILYHNGTEWVALAPGTSGRLLTTQGAGANPIWGAAPNDQRVSFVAQGEQSRSLNTSYLNGTNFRFVCWSFNEAGQGANAATIQTSPNGSTWTTVAHAYPYNYAVGRTLFAIVPPGYYFRYACAGSPSNNNFFESL
jgi:hypothetical protein